MYPAEISIRQVFAEQGTWGIWSNYIRYIGAGAVAAGGIISLIKNLPLMLRTFKQAIGGYGAKGNGEGGRLNQDLPMKFVLGTVAALAVIMWLLPAIPVNLLGAIIIIVFGFFFATVSSRMVGVVGSSNNPVSGMAIATLLIATIILKATGTVGMPGMIAAITIGSIICIIAAIAGDTSQDLKTGFLVGSTPKKQQIGELIGVTTSGIAIGGVLYLLSMAWGYGSSELPAPQASLMKMVVEGVMNGNLPWGLVFVGVFIAIVIEILQIPVLPFAVGLYLPIHLSTPMMVGGAVRWWFERKKEKLDGDAIERGVLYSSGLIAGEGIVGILLAIFAIIKTGPEKTLGDVIDLSQSINIGNWGGLIVFLLLTATLCMIIVGKESDRSKSAGNKSASQKSNAGGNKNAGQSSAGGNKNAGQSNAGGNKNANQSSAGGNKNANQSSAGGNKNASQSSAGGNKNASQSNAGGNKNAGQSNAGGNKNVSKNSGQKNNGSKNGNKKGGKK